MTTYPVGFGTPWAFLICLSLIMGCTKEVDKPRASAKFTLDAAVYDIQIEISTPHITDDIMVYKSFSSITQNNMTGLFLGTHLGDSLQAAIRNMKVAKDKSTKALMVVQSLDKKFVAGTDDPHNMCFTCFAEFTGEGFSLTFIDHLNDDQRQVWSSAFGDQAGQVLTFSNLKVITVDYSPGTPLTYYVMAEVHFSCLVYNASGNSRKLVGDAILPLYGFRD